MKRANRRVRERGIALITALWMSVVFLVLIGGLLSELAGEMVDVGTHQNSMKALDAAYAGVENMVLDIEENASGVGHATPAPINYTYPAPSTVSYSASVTNVWNTNSGLVYYEINSTGTENNSGQQRQVRALVRSFPYSYYEQFTAGNSNNIYYVTGEQFDGPVYNGGTMNIWYQDPGTPIFNNVVQTVSTPAFYQGAGKSSVSLSNVIWGDVTGSGGSSALNITPSPMALPMYQDNLTVASEAFYGDPNHTSQLPTPGSNGLYVNGGPALSGSGTLKSGLYMQGDVIVTPCSGACGSYSGNNQVLYLQTTGGASGIGANYTVAIDYNAQTTTITQTSGCSSSCTVTYSGVPSGQPPAGSAAANGAIFVDGNVTLDSNGGVCSGANCGIIHGDFDIAVPDYTTDHAHTITLGGGAPGIVYKDQSSTSTDELGIWANDINVTSSTTTGYEFDGDILTGYYGECPGNCTDGKFANTKYNNGTVQGTFTFHGGLIQDTMGAMGVSSGGTLISGFSRKYVYDPRLAANPPPGFPITNHYDIVAWLDEGV
jgi:hypothetical protein